VTVAATVPPPSVTAGLRERLVPPLPVDGWWAWPATIGVTLLAAYTRFVALGNPRAVVFDETYYVKEGLSLSRFGYEQQTVADANDRLLTGNADIFTGEAEFVIHPPLGKWVIGAGQWLFGADPYGWRVGVALLGTLTVLLTIRVIRRLTRSALLGLIAGLLLTLDGLHLVLSRNALLDGVLTALVLAGFGCLLLARDSARHRIADWAGERADPLAPVGDAGPRLGWRPWLIAAGVCFGMAAGVKWSGAVFLAVFGVLTVLWDAGARRAAGVRRPVRATARRDLLPSFGALVGVAIPAYLVTWTGWLATDGGWSRQWAAGRETAFPWIPDALRSLWHYHSEMLNSGRNITSDHAYDSPAIGWLFLSRPVSFFYESDLSGCASDNCVAAVTGLGNPAFWWAGAVAIVVGLGLWLGQRDWRAAALLAGVAAGWAPWFFTGDRTIFSWYIVVIAPFLAGLIAMTLGLVMGRPQAEGNRRVLGAAAVGAYLMLVLACFAFFWPIWTAEVIPYDEWYRRMWFRSWI
jgi:dolichyl-phosphate-mannose--protein O-mannosyl transferase